MKKYYIVTVIVLCVVAILLAADIFFDYSKFAHRLPTNAQLIDEHDQVRFYNVNIPDEVGGGVSGLERAYITDNGKILSVLNISYFSVASMILVTDQDIIILSDSETYPGMGGFLYSINRGDGSVAYIPQDGLYFFTAPDHSYAAFGSFGGTVTLTNFGTDISRTYSLNGEFPIRAMSLSPDENHILILSEDVNRRSEEDQKAYGIVFLIDIEKDAQSEIATQVASFEERFQEGPFVPFIGGDSSIVWNSDIQATVTDDDGQTHVISLPVGVDIFD